MALEVESLDVVRRKRGDRVEAQARWPFLNHFDTSTIKNDRQLATMVKERCSLSQADAGKDVRQWMEARSFES